MVSQSAAYSFVKHVSADVFEVTAFRDGHAATYRANPAADFCTCREYDCQHIWDAEHFLRDHACPFCRRYSPFAVPHLSCGAVANILQIAQVA